MKMCTIAAGFAVIAFGLLSATASAKRPEVRHVDRAGAGIQGATEGAVWVRNEPKHHLVFENEDVRVYDVVVPPGDATLLHVHGLDSLSVALGGATLKSEVPGQQPTDMPVTRGEVRFTPGPVTHRVQNVGPTPSHDITVELLRTPSTTPAVLPAPPWNGPESIVIENDRARVTRLVLEAGRATAMYTVPGRMLAIPVTAGNVEVDVAGRTPRTADLRLGTADWQAAAVTEAIRNVGPSGVEIVRVELK